MAKILLVEDDPDLSNMVRTFLNYEHHEVEAVNDGQDGLIRVRTYFYDLVVLDLGLPGATGLEILRALRELGSSTPVIILTGRNSLEEKEHGLDAGADDYLTKPFHMKELGARVRAILRRQFPATSHQILRVGSLTLDAREYLVTAGGKEVNLVPREFQLLEFLMRHPNQIFSAQSLVERIWKDDADGAVPALRTTMRRLRSKIDPSGAILRTVHGSGYVLSIEENQKGVIESLANEPRA